MITIEGNIGTGKTTVAKSIASYMPDTELFQAPDPDHNPHWDAFQQKPKDHALAMQLWFLRERLRVYAAALEHMREKRESVILDFSVWSDQIFARAHYERGYMTDAEFEEYSVLWRAINSMRLPAPHLSIVLHVKSHIRIGRLETSETRAKYVQRASRDDYETHLTRLDELYRQTWLRDQPHVFTPKWLADQRVAPSADGLSAAPSHLILVRDWSQDLSQIKPTAIRDAVMCSEPTDIDTWIAPWLVKGAQERVAALLKV